MSNPIPATHWGQLVRQAREAAGLSQPGLARQTGISANTVSRLERGEYRPGYGTQIRIADALGSTVTALFPRTEGEADLAQRCNGSH